MGIVDWEALSRSDKGVVAEPCAVPRVHAAAELAQLVRAEVLPQYSAPCVGGPACTQSLGCGPRDQTQICGITIKILVCSDHPKPWRANFVLHMDKVKAMELGASCSSCLALATDSSMFACQHMRAEERRELACQSAY